MSQSVVFYLLISVFTLTYFNSWMVLFCTATMPGPKLMSGVIFGVAEASSCLLSGLMVRSIKDSYAVTMFCIIGIFTTTVFYYTGGTDTGLLGSVLLFGEVFSIGAILSLTYVLVETRVPPESFGSTTVLCVTSALICSGFSQFFARGEGIIPTATIVFVFASISIMTLSLPIGG